MVLIASNVPTYLIWAVGGQVSRSSLTAKEDHFYLNKANMVYFRLTDGSGYESYIWLGCIFLNKVIWPAVSSSSMLFPVVPKFSCTLWTLTIYCYITFGRKERQHIVLKTIFPTFGRTTLFQITKAQMWHLLEVLMMPFCSSSFFCNTPNCKGKGSRGRSDNLYIYGANMTFNKLFWEFWNFC